MTTPIAMPMKDAAAEIGCSYSHLNRLARAGELPGAYRLGKRWFIAIEAFHAAFGVVHSPAPGPVAPSDGAAVGSAADPGAELHERAAS